MPLPREETQQREQRINTGRSCEASSRWDRSVVSTRCLTIEEPGHHWLLRKRRVIVVVTSNGCVLLPTNRTPKQRVPRPQAAHLAESLGPGGRKMMEEVGQSREVSSGL